MQKAQQEVPGAFDEEPLFNLNIQQRPLTMSTISQSNSNKIYSSIASSTNNKELVKQTNTAVTSNVNNGPSKHESTESNRTSNDDEKILKSYGTDTGAASDPSDPEQSNNRLIALKNEIDKTMSEINSFKNEVSYRIQNAVDSLTQFDYGKYNKTSSHANVRSPLDGHNKLPRLSQTRVTTTTINSTTLPNRKKPATPCVVSSTTDTAVNTDISMSNAIFKIKYEDEDELQKEEQTVNDNGDEEEDDDDLMGELDDDDDTDKSLYSDNSQRSIGTFFFC